MLVLCCLLIFPGLGMAQGRGQSQGQGMGGPLIEKGLQTTDTLKVPTFLETFTPRNMTFYNRLGYTAAASFYEPTAKAEYWIMTRDPV